MLALYDRLKKQAAKEGKILFVSNTNILKERMSDFDKVINIPKDEFKKRFDARGATYGFEDWKSDIDATIAKVDKSKVISTTGYLSDLLEGNPKTRRILEVQSDLFQKGRNKKDLVFGEIEEQPTFLGEENQYEPDFYAEEYNYRVRAGEIKPNQEQVKSNQFLQLLNQGSNWVTFFVKSIIQDSAKKGYEKVLFPSGNTASKVEGHTTLEEFKRTKELRLKQINEQLAKGEVKENFKIETRDLYSIRNVGYAFKVNNNQRGVDTSDEFKTREDAQKWIDNKNNPTYEVKINLTEDELNIYQNNLIEKEALEKELERIDREGFGALKPIYNFYENTVANILKKQGYSPKQVTDEYGNTWNEIEIVPEREKQAILLQKKGTETSAASPQTISMIKDFLKRIGVDIKSMQKIIVDGVKYDANGVAVIMQKLIQVVEGKEASVLPEEAMHFAVEIIKQTNPALYKQLLKEINSYRILNQVFTDYGTDPNYQTEDGKPDVIKLKDEAIAKVLVETIIKRNEGSTEKPELLAKAESWWDKIVNFFKSLFAKSGFDQAAIKVMSGEFEGTVADIRADNTNIYLQKSAIQERIVNDLKATRDKIDKDDDGYFRIGSPDKRLPRVSDFIYDWYDNRFRDKKLTESEFSKAVFEMMAEKGTLGHADIEHMLKNYFLDEDGKFISDKNQRPNDDDYVSRLNPDDKSMYETLKKNMEQRLGTFPEGTVFLAETMVFNGKIAGTIDFIAITPEGKVSVLDWKFMGLNVDRYTDVPWYKVLAWKQQMGLYKNILKSYGIKEEDFQQTRMIPIRARYDDAIPSENILPKLKDIEIGDVIVKNEERAYLLPVGLEEERTGNKRIDKLIKKLNKEYEALSEKKVTPEQKAGKAEELNYLYNAIRQLQIRQNLKPLLEQAQVLTKNVKALIERYNTTFKGKDPKSFSEAEKNQFSADLMTYEDSLSIYANLSALLKGAFTEEMSEEDEQLKKDLREVSESATDLLLDLKEDVIDEFGESIIAASKNVIDLLKPEKIIKGLSKWFGTTSTIQLTSANVLFKLMNEAYGKAAMDTQIEAAKLQGIQERFTKWASSKGLTQKNRLSLIKKEGKMELIDEFDSKFYKNLQDNIEKAKIETNQKAKEAYFDNIRNSVDVDVYEKELERLREEEYKKIDSNPRYNENDVKREKDKINTLYSIKTADSFGWLLYNHIKKFPKRELWESKEYSELYKKDASGNYVNAPAVELFEYIKDRNEDLDELGYINSKDARVFLPFVRKGLMEKIVTGGKIKFGEELLRAITVSEGEIGYGQTNPITEEPIFSIPKFFTKNVQEELSEDLFTNLTLLNDMAFRYKYLSQIESQANLIARIESNKEAIKTSFFSRTKYKSDGEPETTSDNSDNTKLIRDMIEAGIYGHKFIENENFDQILVNLGTFGKTLNDKLGVNIFPEQFDNKQISLNKSISQLNNFFQIKTLALNPVSSIANLLGGSFQSIINAGTYFSKEEFLANEFLMGGREFGLGDNDAKVIGALEYFLPLTEDYNIQSAKKLSLNKFSQQGVQEFLMSWMRKSDQFVQTVNFVSFLKNTVVVDNQVVNAREYLRNSPEYKDKFYAGTPSENKEVAKRFEEDVKKLIDEKGVLKLAEIKDGEFVIPGVDRKSDSVFAIRRKVQQLSKDALGNLSVDEIRKINLTIYGKSFMMYKSWIPRLVDVRAGNLKYNSGTEAYEWGRTRMMFRMLKDDLFGALDAFKSSLLGDEKGQQRALTSFRELYERKKADYEKDTGKKLNMTQDEFIQLIHTNLKNQVTDILFYATLTALFLGMKAIPPDEDANRATMNRYKYALRILDKVRDEIAYFYDPTSLLSLTSSGIFPSLSYINNFKKLFGNFLTEMYAIGIDDEKLQKKNQVIKYLLKGFPITSQFDSIFLLFFPDIAKDLGMKPQSESRPLGM